jgi:hypothetical protein
MPHLLDRGFPARTRQSLLRDEIRAVADGTARKDQSFRSRRQRSTHRSQVLFLSRRHNCQPYETKDHAEADSLNLS